MLEIDQVARLMSGGVFNTPVLGRGQAVIISVSGGNADIVVGQDLTTAFLEVRDMNYYLVVFGGAALRIKQPGAITTLAQRYGPLATKRINVGAHGRAPPIQ